jgi:hypothetical protein
MKNLLMLLCIFVSPLTFASYHGDDSSGGSNSGSKSSGGYGGGSGGSAAALLAVGAVIYFVRRNNSEEESEFGFVRNFKKSKFDISLGNNNYFQDSFENYSNEFGASSNKFQFNLKYNFN